MNTHVQPTDTAASNPIIINIKAPVTVPGSILGLVVEAFCVECMCSPRVSVGFIQVLWFLQSKTTHYKLIELAKLAKL